MDVSVEGEGSEGEGFEGEGSSGQGSAGGNSMQEVLLDQGLQRGRSSPQESRNSVIGAKCQAGHDKIGCQPYQRAKYAAWIAIPCNIALPAAQQLLGSKVLSIF